MRLPRQIRGLSGTGVSAVASISYSVLYSVTCFDTVFCTRIQEHAMKIPRWLKWVGVAIYLVLLTVIVTSAFGYVEWMSTGRSIGIGNGSVFVVWYKTITPNGWSAGWHRSLSGLSPLLPGCIHPVPSATEIYAPLWIPFLIIAGGTFFLFRRERRLIPPGHCRKCSYNLTGNTSGICPECGEKI